MKMNCPVLTTNESRVDRLIRFIVGLVSAFVGYSYLTGKLQMVAYVVSVIALVTSAVGYCGLYALLGISTAKRSSSTSSKNS